MIRHILAIGAVAGLTACGGGGLTTGGSGPGVTRSGLVTVGADGSIPTAADAEQLSVRSLNLGGYGATYVVQSRGNDVSARAALVNPRVFNVPVTSGRARFETDFSLSEIRNTATSREITDAEGTLPVTIDFATGRVQGQGDGLSVSGQMTAGSTAFTGTATWRGVDGDIRGRADADNILGAFAGNAPTSVYAGAINGFVPSTNP